jgi:chlorobactene glucosyltransferase
VSPDTLFGPVTTLMCAAILVNIASNHLSLRRIPRETASRRTGSTGSFVSVLVPARNERDSILQCVGSILAQSHADIEVIVLDDESSDDTFSVVSSVNDRRLRVLRGAPLPEGWTGKNWACHQLAEAASHSRLLFVDADTVLAPDAVSDALAELDRDGNDLVTFLVAPDSRGAAPDVVLPMVNYALMALFPAWLMNSRRFPRTALALGPFILVTRDAYDAVGGHAGEPASIADDVRLCRAVKRTGRRVRIANGSDLVRTRWYGSVPEMWRGFSKNAFAALEHSAVLAALTLAVLVPLLVAPFLRVADGIASGDISGEALAQVMLLAAGRLATSISGADPMWSVPLFPVTVLFWGATLAWSVVITTSQRSVTWRGRAVALRDRSP